MHNPETIGTDNPAELIENRIPKRLYTAKEIAAGLSIAAKKVYRLAAAGKIPVIEVGGAKRFDWEDVLGALKGKVNGNVG